MDEKLQEVLERLEYMENAIQILLQLTTWNAEHVADIYNTVIKAEKVNNAENDGLN